MPLNLPTLAARGRERYATPKHQITPAPLVKEAKKAAKKASEVEFRKGVWLRDEGRSRASRKPLARSGTDFHKVGQVHHVVPRSLAPERVYDITNGILLSAHEHALAEAICPNDPAHRLLDIEGPDDRGEKQTFIWRDVNGVELKRKVKLIRWAWLLLLPFGSLAYGVIWLRKRWLAHEQAKVDALIKAPIYHFTVQDEALRVTAERRRAAAEDKRRQARQIESGEPVEHRIRIVR